MSHENSSSDDEIDDPELTAEIEQNRRKIFFAGWQRHSRAVGDYWLYLGGLSSLGYVLFWLQRNWPFADGVHLAWDKKALGFTLLCCLAISGLFIRAGHFWAMFVALLINLAFLVLIPASLISQLLMFGGFLWGLYCTYIAIRVIRLLREHNVPLRDR